MLRGAQTKCHAVAAQAVPMLAHTLQDAVGDVVGCGFHQRRMGASHHPDIKRGLGVRDSERCWAETRVAAIV